MSSPAPLRKTRLRRPPVAGDFVPRPRLTELLRRGRSGVLTLVCAPAGYGKTTLVSDFVGELDVPVAWVSLSARTDSLSAFVRDLAAAVGAAVGAASPSVDLRADDILAAAASPAEAAAHVADALDELTHDLVLVLDELEGVGSPPIHDFVVALLEYPPRPLHMIVTTRHDPPWPLVALRARGQLCDVRQDVLAFHADEARAFIERASGHRLADALLDQVVTRTEGWAAAVRMLALALSGTTSPDELTARLPLGIAHVEEYLAHEVLARQPRGLRDRLIRTSLFERVHMDLCDAVCEHAGDGSDGGGDSDGIAAMEHVIATNLFVTVEADGWLRFHPLLREHLRHELNTSVEPAEIRALHDTARDWFDVNGYIDEAIEHALQGSRPESAADVLVRHRIELMNADRQDEIAAWIARIRAGTRASGPLFRLLDAWGTVPMHELSALLDDIDAGLRELPLPDDERRAISGEIHALRSLAASHKSAFESAARHAGQALEMIPISSTAARAFATFASATNAQSAGDFAAARRAIEAGVAEHEHGPGLATIQLADTLVRWNAGHLRETIANTTRAEEHRDAEGARSSLVLMRAQAGIAHYRRNELVDAERILRRDGVGAFPFGRLTLARCLEAQGHSDEADQIVTDLIAHAAGTRSPDLAALSHATRAELSLRRGDCARALAWAEDVDEKTLRATSTLRPAGVILAAALSAAGDAGSAARASTLLARLHDEAGRAHRVPILAEVLTVQASLAQRRGDENAAVSALISALENTRRGSMLRGYLDLAPNLIALLVHPAIPEHLHAHARLIADAARAAVIHARAGMTPTLAADLTNREEDVLELLADRLTNKEIAQRLHIAAETVKRHLGNVYSKLHVHGRREAVAKARALGVLPPR